MTYGPLGQFALQVKPLVLTSSPEPTKTLATVSSPTLVPVTTGLLRPLAPAPSVVVTPPARGGVVVTPPARQVTSRDRALAASKMAARIADRIRVEKFRLAATSEPRKALDSAETRIRGLALMLPSGRMTIVAAYTQVASAQREVNAARLDARTHAAILGALQALRASIAPPARAQVAVAPPPRLVVTASQATTIQSAVDAAVSKLAASGTPVTEVTVKQAATDIIKDVAPDATQATTMISSLNQSPLVVSGAAKTDDTAASETLTSAPLTTESVTALIESTESAPPVAEPAAEKKDEPASPPATPADLVAAPPPADAGKKADEVTSLVAPAEAPKKEGLFGIPWLYVGLGAGALVVGGVIMSRRPAPTPNRRKRSSKRRSS